MVSADLKVQAFRIQDIKLLLVTPNPVEIDWIQFEQSSTADSCSQSQLPCDPRSRLSWRFHSAYVWTIPPEFDFRTITPGCGCGIKTIHGRLSGLDPNHWKIVSLYFRRPAFDGFGNKEAH